MQQFIDKQISYLGELIQQEEGQKLLQKCKSNECKSILLKQYPNSRKIDIDIGFKDYLWSNHIDIICEQIEKTFPQYYYMGIGIYSDFEDALYDKECVFNIDYIFQQIKDNPQKSIFGWIINECHKYSSGQHWVSMAIIILPNHILKVLYYDSQGPNGPNLGKIKCDIKINANHSQYDKYQSYQSHFKEWWQLFTQKIKQYGYTLYQETVNNKQLNGLICNTQWTQTDNYSCGYHAIYFQYLLAKQPQLKLNAINTIITYQKNLDKRIHLFQNQIFNFNQ